MKLKRFTAPDIRQAMTKVRAELGGDAVILSNRKTDDGVEIIAATDYDDAVVDSASNTRSPDKIPDSAASNEVQNVIKAKKTATSKRSNQSPNQQINQQGASRRKSQAHSSRQEQSQSKAYARDSQSSDPLSAANTRNLAEHLQNTLDIKAPSPTQKTTPVSRWKEALDDVYDDDTSELDELLSMDDVKGDKKGDEKDIEFEPNHTQVSSEWINKFSSNTEEEKSDPVPSTESQKENGPDMENVWNELSSLRGLLETQLSSLAWTEASKRHPVKAKTLKHLLELGLTPEMSYDLLDKMDDADNFETCWRKSLAVFAKRMLTIEDDMIKKGGVFALVGPTGVGKTTTIAKMAARYALTHGTSSIALVTTDNYRIGAQEQLRTYGRILGTPVKIANNATELRQVLKSLYDKDLVLIDTAGTSQRDIRLTEQFSMLSEGSSLIKSYLVLSASSQQQVLSETVEAYKKVHLDGCVLTKLDESITLGGALSTIVQNKLPLAYVSDGQRVPEDLHLAKAVELIKKAVSMMNNAQIKLDDNVLEMAFGGLAAHDLS